MAKKSSVIAQPAEAVNQRLITAARERCACCGGPTLPVLESRAGVALCNRCARFCESKGGKYTHALPARIDWPSADRIWAVDLGFKKLGQ
ncbi:MAG TPA: hypothetical protein VJG32_15855 [Anaerolineae bacterium]|nr:hypothetical protein [Anaerolineae bacterium]